MLVAIVALSTGLASEEKAPEGVFRIGAEAPRMLDDFVVHERMHEAMIATTREVFGLLQLLQRCFFCVHGTLVHKRG